MIQTSYHGKYKGDDGVIISNSTPKGCEVFESYPDLIPSWQLVNAYKMGYADKRHFENEYRKQLDGLDAQKVYDDLDGKVLLSLERSSEFSHRHLVVAWLEEKLGVKVEEI